MTAIRGSARGVAHITSIHTPVHSNDLITYANYDPISIASVTSIDVSGLTLGVTWNPPEVAKYDCDHEPNE